MASWESVKEDIEGFVENVEITGHSVACVVGPHGCGKSTTMVKHVCFQLMEKVADVSMTYVFSTELEASIMCEILNTREDLGLSGYVRREVPADAPRDTFTGRNQNVIVTCYNAILSSYRKGGQLPFGDRALVMVDLEVSPTTDGEVFLGLLMEWAYSHPRDKDAVCAIMTISNYSCERTKFAMRKLVAYPDEITIPGKNPAVPISQGEMSADGVAAAVVRMREADPETKILVGVSGETKDELESLYYHSARLEKQCEADVLGIDVNLSASLPLGPVKHFVSRDLHTGRMFDPSTSQIVNYTTFKTLKKVHQEQSWLAKSDIPLEDTVFHTTYHLSDLKNPAVEPNAAYSQDIVWTALTLVETWPRKREDRMPVREPPDQLAIKEIFKRLIITGCVNREGSSGGIGELSPKGRAMLRLKRQTEESLELDHHVAQLLAHVVVDDMKENVKRVIIRLAALLSTNLPALCMRDVSSSTRPSLEGIGSICRGVGWKYFDRGSLWVSFGVYQDLLTRGILSDPESEGSIRDKDIVTDVNRMKYVLHLVGFLQNILGVETRDELDDTDLTPDEMLFVESRLLRAYLDQLVFIDNTVGAEPRDVVCLVDFSAAEEEVLHFLSFRGVFGVGIDNQAFAFYTQLTMHSTAGEYEVAGMTALSKHLANEFEEETGYPVYSLATAYPMAPR
ncbi:hypothetical protein F4805DRAFT_456694 [Annulohypoxylon moriforme]|nr:hypothetical protein F4805DRAFT_456694 [Annulohypoxylon moriforme]